MALQNVRGTHDLLPDECAKHRLVAETARSIATRFGFREMATPIFEFSEVFKKTLGDASDIVGKEMYSFVDRGGEELTLRPEGTAGIARAFLSQGLSQSLPLKLFYQGPMFRYERPQKGRQRQFHQLGVELLGVSNPWADVECISLAREILRALKIDSFQLEINSIGDVESRQKYRQTLVSYFEKVQNELSSESQKRLQTNPLRILDSKDPKDQKFLPEAPRLQDALTTASREIFESVQSGLKQLGLDFVINPYLVRGLDYYNDVVFEFKTTELGAQDAILSGGRYDGLIGMMGGPATPGIGWAAGIERLCLLNQLQAKPQVPVVIIPVHGGAENFAFELAGRLRRDGLYVEVGFSGNVSKRMKKASQFQAEFAVLIGPDEIQNQTCTLKNLQDGTQSSVALSDLAKVLKDAR